MESGTLAKIYQMVGQYIDTIFDVGNDVISFIMKDGNEIVLIPLAATLVFGIIGAVRSFIKTM